MARPNWEYIRVDVLLPGHPKLAGLPRSARWTLIELWCFAGRYHTDGFVSDDVWGETGPSADRRKLVERGFAERVDGGYMMHDFTGPDGHQRSLAEIKALSAKRAEAGRKGGGARGNTEASASADAKQVLQLVPAPCSDTAQPEAVAVTEAVAKDQKIPLPTPPESASPKGATRATRLPEDFRITDDMAAWAAENVPHANLAFETANFRDYWRAESGQKAAKRDWAAAWRTWMRRAGNGVSASHPPQRTTTNDRVQQAIEAGKRVQAMLDGGS